MSAGGNSSGSNDIRGGMLLKYIQLQQNIHTGKSTAGQLVRQNFRTLGTVLFACAKEIDQLVLTKVFSIDPIARRGIQKRRE